MMKGYFMNKKVCFLYVLLVLLSRTIYSDELIPFSFNGKFGYVNSKLEVIIEPSFRIAGHFSDEGFAIVSYDALISGLIWMRDGIINRKGEMILRSNSRVIYHVYDDIYSIPAEKGNGYILRLRSNRIIARQAGAGSASKDGYILATFPYEEKRYGFIDFEGGKVLTNLNMQRGSASFFEQRAIIYNEEWDPIIIDMKGNIIGNIAFSRLGYRYSEGLVPAKAEDGRIGYVDLSGSFAFVIPFVVGDVPEATLFSDGYAAIKTNANPSVWKIINIKGEIVSGDILVSGMRAFSSGLSLVSVYNREKKEIKYGYVNTRGEYLIRPILDNADNFRNDYARIVHNGREGLLKTNGEIIWSSDIMIKYKE
jgi:hypothetical protein